MNGISLDLINNLQQGTAKAGEKLAATQAPDAGAGFLELLNVKDLTAELENLPLAEQGKVLKDFVLELPKNSLQEMTGLIKENFPAVLEEFPQLGENLAKGDVKSFVDNLVQVIEEKDVATPLQLDTPANKQELLHKASNPIQPRNFFPNSKKVTDAKLAQPELSRSSGQAGSIQPLTNANELSTLKMNTVEKQEVPLQSESHANDFLKLREMGKANKSNIAKTNNTFLTQAKENVLDQKVAEMESFNSFGKNSNFSNYSKQMDQFSDKLIKPQSVHHFQQVESANQKNLNGHSTMESANLLTPLAVEMLPESNQQQMMSSDDQSSDLGETGKILDLKGISATNKNELISKISNYIQQNAIANESEVELTVRHEELGQFKINVQKTKSDHKQLSIEIASGTKEAHNFFAEHEVDLIKSLNSSGIKVSGLKLTQLQDGKIATFTENSHNMSDNNNQQGGFSSGQQGQNLSRQQGQMGSGQERRKDLWNMYREQMNHTAA